ncbi:MAG: hypothetical protein EOM54_09455 [Clostridia bacterium]|nr:hypothetical protein [Clostridia bacterium]
MKRLGVILIAVFLLFSCLGCQRNEGEESGRSDENVEGNVVEAEESNSPSPDGSGFGFYDSGDQITAADYAIIDWNLDAYTSYFCVVSGGNEVHYWNGGETVLGYFPGIIMLVDSAAGTSVTVDLSTGYTSEGYGAMPMPDFGGGTDEDMERAPVQALFYSGRGSFREQDVMIYTVDVGVGTAEYYVSTPDLVCIGWEVSSSEGAVTYFLGEDPGFEAVVDAMLEENTEAPNEASGDEPDYSDTDGDGFSDWNEERRPTSEELHELSELWKSEGMSQAEYLKRATELSFAF